nr:MAG TPA: hypothetical protein [Caudoviricetes sp.]
MTFSEMVLTTPSMISSEMTTMSSSMKFITGIKYIFRLTTPYVYVSHV